MSYVNPKHVAEELRHYGISQEALAALAGLSQTAVNRWLRGGLQLTVASQFKISETLNCLTQLIASCPLPIDFRRPIDLKPALERFKAQLCEADAARIHAEIAAAGEAASTA